MVSYLDRFVQFMNGKGFNITRQRLRIAEVFFDMHGHRNLEEIYDTIRNDDASIGQTTVYRTIKLLCEAGLALEHRFGDGAARYEPLNAQTHHDHLICQNCGKTVEIRSESIEALQKQLAAEHGYHLTGHAHYLYGQCPDCQTSLTDARLAD